MTGVDASAAAAAAAIAAALESAEPRAVVGVYLHGSAVLGDFSWDRSDLDLLVVVEDGTDEPAIERVGDVLLVDRPRPGRGLESSVVDRSAAAAPRPPWPFRLHVATGPGDERRVSGRDQPGDPDLALHYFVTRSSGVVLCGPPVDAVVGAVPRAVVRDQLASELNWAISEADAGYAVLNACRALRFAREGVVCSKTAAGTWAVKRGIEPELVRRALDDRERGATSPVVPPVEAWVRAVVTELRG
jgi:hypothetical protein